MNLIDFLKRKDNKSPVLDLLGVQPQSATMAQSPQGQDLLSRAINSKPVQDVWNSPIVKDVRGFAKGAFLNAPGEAPPNTVEQVGEAWSYSPPMAGGPQGLTHVPMALMGLMESAKLLKIPEEILAIAKKSRTVEELGRFISKLDFGKQQKVVDMFADKTNPINTMSDLFNEAKSTPEYKFGSTLQKAAEASKNEKFVKDLQIEKGLTNNMTPKNYDFNLEQVAPNKLIKTEAPIVNEGFYDTGKLKSANEINQLRDYEIQGFKNRGIDVAQKQFIEKTATPQEILSKLTPKEQEIVWGKTSRPSAETSKSTPILVNVNGEIMMGDGAHALARSVNEGMNKPIKYFEQLQSRVAPTGTSAEALPTKGLYDMNKSITTKDPYQYIKQRLPEIKTFDKKTGTFTTKDGNTIRVGIREDGQIYDIEASKKGTGLGSRVVAALKEWSMKDYKGLSLDRNYNQKFWEKQGFTSPNPNDPNAMYGSFRYKPWENTADYRKNTEILNQSRVAQHPTGISAVASPTKGLYDTGSTLRTREPYLTDIKSLNRNVDNANYDIHDVYQRLGIPSRIDQPLPKMPKEVTVYRAITKNSRGGIVNGSYVTTDKNFAQGLLESIPDRYSKVISQKVNVSDLAIDPLDMRGLVYRPRVAQPTFGGVPGLDLEKMQNLLRKRGKQ